MLVRQRRRYVGLRDQFYIRKTNSLNYNLIDSLKDSRTSSIIWYFQILSSPNDAVVFSLWIWITKLKRAKPLNLHLTYRFSDYFVFSDSLAFLWRRDKHNLMLCKAKDFVADCSISINDDLRIYIEEKLLWIESNKVWSRFKIWFTESKKIHICTLHFK